MQPRAHVPGWMPSSKLFLALGRRWAHGRLTFTIPFSPVKTQFLSLLLYDNSLGFVCGAKHLIWCRNTSKVLQTCIFVKIFKHWRCGVDIIWDHIGPYESAFHNEVSSLWTQSCHLNICRCFDIAMKACHNKSYFWLRSSRPLSCFPTKKNTTCARRVSIFPKNQGNCGL